MAAFLHKYDRELIGADLPRETDSHARRVTITAYIYFLNLRNVLERHSFDPHNKIGAVCFGRRLVPCLEISA